MASYRRQSGYDNYGKQGRYFDDYMGTSNVADVINVQIRLGFLRKVYGILSVQLLFTTLVAGLFIAVEPVKNFVRSNPSLLLASAVISVGLIFALQWKSREYPTNYILLGVFTLCEATLVGTAVTRYEVASVILAFALTCAVTIGLTIYTLQSQRDFSSWGAGLFAAVSVLMLAGFLQVFWRGAIHQTALAAGAAVIFSLYIIYDTHMIMKRVQPEEYIHASVSLYLDIINLFLQILKLLGEKKKEK